MPLKHPEFVVRLAETMKQKGYSYHIHLIGSGELEKTLQRDITEKKLTEEITLYGFQEPERVRDIMEQCHIHLFTSNQLEGWGAVVNEGMNSGLCEVVNSQVGCAPFLIQDGGKAAIRTLRQKSAICWNIRMKSFAWDAVHTRRLLQSGMQSMRQRSCFASMRTFRRAKLSPLRMGLLAGHRQYRPVKCIRQSVSTENERQSYEKKKRMQKQ